MQALKMSLFGFAPPGHHLLFDPRVLSELAANQRCGVLQTDNLLLSIVTGGDFCAFLLSFSQKQEATTNYLGIDRASTSLF